MHRGLTTYELKLEPIKTDKQYYYFPEGKVKRKWIIRNRNRDIKYSIFDKALDNPENRWILDHLEERK